MSSDDGLEPLYPRPLSGEAVTTAPPALVPPRAILKGETVQLEPMDAAKHATELF